MASRSNRRMDSTADARPSRRPLSTGAVEAVWSWAAVTGARRQRPKRAGQKDVLSRRAAWILLAPIAAILMPVIVSIALIARVSGPDLYDLAPVVSRSGEYRVLAWPELERAKRALSEGGISSGTMIRALGYMMDGERPVRDGELVREFVLLPSAGNPVHHAHRFGDQMIEVRLKGGQEVRFSERTLVWVWGSLRVLPGDPSGHEPLYALEQARIEPANKMDIQQYFK